MSTGSFLWGVKVAECRTSLSPPHLFLVLWLCICELVHPHASVGLHALYLYSSQKIKFHVSEYLKKVNFGFIGIMDYV